MNQIEKNVIASFENVKEDFARMRETIVYLNQQQMRLQAEIASLKARKVSSRPRPVARRAKKRFIASKAGEYVHAEHSLQAKRIKASNKVIFKTLKGALNQGYKLGDSLRG